MEIKPLTVKDLLNLRGMYKNVTGVISIQRNDGDYILSKNIDEYHFHLKDGNNKVKVELDWTIDECVKEFNKPKMVQALPEIVSDNVPETISGNDPETITITKEEYAELKRCKEEKGWFKSLIERFRDYSC